MKTQDAYNEIKRVILRTNPSDSYAFSENYFSETLRMSRTPVRSALQQLQFEGLISIIPHQGIVIRDLSYEEANQLFEFRKLVEGFLISKSVEKLDDEDFLEMDRLNQELRGLLRRKDYEAYLDLDEYFHLYIYHHHDNPAMIDVIRRFKSRTYRIRLKRLKSRKNLESPVNSHAEIIRLLRERKVPEAVAELERHQASLEDYVKYSGSD